MATAKEKAEALAMFVALAEALQDVKDLKGLDEEMKKKQSQVEKAKRDLEYAQGQVEQVLENAEKAKAEARRDADHIRATAQLEVDVARDQANKEVATAKNKAAEIRKLNMEGLAKFETDLKSLDKQIQDRKGELRMLETQLAQAKESARKLLEA